MSLASLPSNLQANALAEGHSRGEHAASLREIPPARAQRERIRAAASTFAARLAPDYPPSRRQMELLARELLGQLGEKECYVGWTMVQLASSFWREQLGGIPHARRLFMLPPAAPDEAATLARVRSRAQALGYQIFSTQQSPAVLKALVEGQADGVVGIAPLDLLEKAMNAVVRAGIPCMAVPLLPETAGSQPIDEDWVLEMIELPLQTAPRRTRTYLHLLREAAQMFQRGRLEQLAPRLRGAGPLSRQEGALGKLDPVAGTEAISYDFVAKGGKHSRPFITLAVHDALTGGRATQADGGAHLATLAPAIHRTALSIEVFHKASLVHDDIEDEDPFRYGEPTIHRTYGLATAINVGDYLIGLGYRLVSRETAALGAERVATIIDHLADAHLKLSEGQGAELLWRDARDKRLTVSDALKIYQLKTAPAFEAALLSGLCLAETGQEYAPLLIEFSQHLGVAFQILNDLGDWSGDTHNKLRSGGDVLGGRPTLLWSLALQELTEPDRDELLRISSETEPSETTVARIGALYRQADVFAKAGDLVHQHEEQARAIADRIGTVELRELLYFLMESVLERPAPLPGAPSR